MEIGMKNCMEDIVAAKMPQILAQMDVCKCERCGLDMLAYVLNKMPPKYVVTDKGGLYAKLSLMQSQFDVDIVTHLTHAAALVRDNPRHEA